MSIERNGPLCNCGNAGCLEAIASGTALANIANERLRQGEQSAMKAMADGDGIRAEAVMQAAAQGDALARELVDQFARDLGQGLANLLHIFNPEMISSGRRRVSGPSPVLRAPQGRHSTAGSWRT